MCVFCQVRSKYFYSITYTGISISWLTRLCKFYSWTRPFGLTRISLFLPSQSRNFSSELSGAINHEKFPRYVNARELVSLHRMANPRSTTPACLLRFLEDAFSALHTRSMPRSRENPPPETVIIRWLVKIVRWEIARVIRDGFISAGLR